MKIGTVLLKKKKQIDPLFPTKLYTLQKCLCGSICTQQVCHVLSHQLYKTCIYIPPITCNPLIATLKYIFFLSCAQMTSSNYGRTNKHSHVNGKMCAELQNYHQFYLILKYQPVREISALYLAYKCTASTNYSTIRPS